MTPAVRGDSGACAVRQEAGVALFELGGSILDAIADLGEKERLLERLAGRRADVGAVRCATAPTPSTRPRCAASTSASWAPPAA